MPRTLFDRVLSLGLNELPYTPTFTNIQNQGEQDNKYKIDADDIVNFRVGGKAKIVERFTVGEYNLAIMTKHRAMPLLQNRMFFVKRLDDSGGFIISQSLPGALEAFTAGSIHEVRLRTRRLLHDE